MRLADACKRLIDPVSSPAFAVFLLPKISPGITAATRDA